MSLLDETPLNTPAYTGAGVYPFSFKCFDDDELEVTHIDTAGVRTLLTKTTHYSVTLNSPSYQGGSVTTTYPTVTTGHLEIKTKIPFSQSVDLTATGPLNLTQFQKVEDRFVMRLQLLRMMLELEYTGRTFQGGWVTATSYTVGDLVIHPSEIGLYACKAVHTSGVFATDLTAGKWEAVITETDLLTAAGLPAISAGDALKAVRVNAGETGYELGHVVPKPTSSNKGSVPIVNVGASDYESVYAHSGPAPRGLFTWLSATQLKIGGLAEYNIYGFGPAWVTSDLTITPTISAPSYWHYIYIKASPAARVLTAADILDTTVAPAYDAAKGGWYDASGNLCVFMLWIDGSNNITKWWHAGDRRVAWDDGVVARAYAALGAGWVSTAIVSIGGAPKQAERAGFAIRVQDPTNSALYYYRPKGSTATTGCFMASTVPTTAISACIMEDLFIIAGSTSGLDIRSDQSTSLAYIEVQSWDLPEGM